MVIKLPIFASPMFAIIKRRFPEMKLIYSLRNPRDCLQSYYNIFQVNLLENTALSDLVVHKLL